ncbi:tripartite tricarboxylate transporter substrate binding protein [Roseibium marinum]|uniref:Tripartite-type tricarboxylate transporter receptor subunit TctC n=1 Tax=Roseibium marinum TaxID=281252 RepID=A0A2S3V3N0_9HYPH|nr:tripartite tricarboxylate transporter substrate binding protein [Roseibium marinum]POF34500.1 tripartite-type tricarboxylate transporter receptor subunit TctC [Roseibium marinum]
MRNRFIRSLTVAAAALVACTGIASAEWPEKPITFVVPYSPGGGFDAYVRAVAPEMEKILGTEVVVENIPGAGGQKGASTVYRSDPDGYTIGIWNVPGLTVPQLLGKSTGYDLTDVTWIGNLATSNYALAVKADSPFNSLKELCSQGKPFKHSDTGPASTSSVTARVAMTLIDCPIQNVTGYKGSTDTIIGLMRGEVDATIKPLAQLLKYRKSGDVKILMTFEETRSAEDIPTSTELGYPDFANFDLRRIVGGPPGIPADIQEKLSAALLQAADAPSVQEWAASSNNALDPVGAEEASAIMQRLMDFYGSYKDVLAQ